jgi:hypothetical protein
LYISSSPLDSYIGFPDTDFNDEAAFIEAFLYRVRTRIKSNFRATPGAREIKTQCFRPLETRLFVGYAVDNTKNCLFYRPCVSEPLCTSQKALGNYFLQATLRHKKNRQSGQAATRRAEDYNNQPWSLGRVMKFGLRDAALIGSVSPPIVAIVFIKLFV